MSNATIRDLGVFQTPVDETKREVRMLSRWISFFWYRQIYGNEAGAGEHRESGSSMKNYYDKDLISIATWIRLLLKILETSKQIIDLVGSPGDLLWHGAQQSCMEEAYKAGIVPQAISPNALLIFSTCGDQATSIR